MAILLGGRGGLGEREKFRPVLRLFCFAPLVVGLARADDLNIGEPRAWHGVCIGWNFEKASCANPRRIVSEAFEKTSVVEIDALGTEHIVRAYQSLERVDSFMIPARWARVPEPSSNQLFDGRVDVSNPVPR